MAISQGSSGPGVRRRMRRVGHKGAHHLAHGNTAESFDAALSLGVDMIEFDVLPENRDGSGELLLAHDYEDMAARTPLTLDEGLAHLATSAFAAIELDVDMKLPGYEERIVAALRTHGLSERALVSTMETVSLPRMRALAPEIRLGWSVPRVRRDYLAHPATKPLAFAAIGYLRRSLPARLGAALRAGEIDAVMSHWSLVTPRFARAIRAAGGELYVWTVDEAPRIQQLERLGVDGVITNDPRLFGAPAAG